MMRNTNRQKGYSLIEVLIALTILIIGIIAVYRLFPLSMRQARIAQEKTIASELADARMARLRTVGAANLMIMNFAGGVYADPHFSQNTMQTTLAAQQVYAMYESYTTTLQRMQGASEVYLQRALFTVDMFDGRQETFVTYVVEQ